MSLKNELNNMASYLRSTRKAILGRGGEISETAGLKEVANAVYRIPTDTSLVYRSDDSVAYQKIVPIGAEEYAQVAKVGGMTYKTKNLLKYPFFNSTKTVYGITFTDNGDGTITANGTATGQAQFLIIGGAEKKTIPAGTYTMSGCPNGGSVSGYFINSSLGQEIGSGKTFTVTQETSWWINITILSGTTVNNLVFKPMFNEGDTALPYEPYFEGLRDTAVSELVSEGANLIPFPYVDSSKTNHGVAFTVQDNGWIIANGTATGGNAEFWIVNEDATNYTSMGAMIFSGCPQGGSTSTYYIRYRYDQV